MSLAIFNKEARRTSCAWRPLGYIANEEFFFSASEIDANKPDVKNECFHCQLSVILESYYRALFDIPLCLGNKSKHVNLYVPPQFILGDVEVTKLHGNMSFGVAKNGL
jgi:hypothetical protein